MQRSNAGSRSGEVSRREWAIGELAPDSPHTVRSEPPLEQHSSIKEVAELWGLCENSVRDLFKAEPGILRIQRPKSRYKRAYTTIRIPKSVLERVHCRMSLVS